MVWLLDTTGTSLSVSLYMFAMAALTFFSVYLVTEKKVRWPRTWRKRREPLRKGKTWRPAG